MAHLEPLLFDKLTIEVNEQAPDRLVAVWSGRGDSRDEHGTLEKYLSALLKRSLEGKKKLELHFEQLDFFNSTTVGAVLRLLRAAHEAKSGLELTYDAERRWQCVTFEALDKAASGFGTGGTHTIIRPVQRMPRT